MDNDTITFIFILLIPIVVVAVPIYYVAKRSSARAKFIRESKHALSTNAMVIGKRTEVGGNDIGICTAYFVTFDIEGIGRAEFNVAGNFSGLLAEGDRGILYYLTDPLRLVNFIPAPRPQQFQQ